MGQGSLDYVLRTRNRAQDKDMIAVNGDGTVYLSNVGIGDTSPDYKLDVWGTICQDTNSDDTCDGTVTSDIRLKKNITKIENALDKVQKLSGIQFYWNESMDAAQHLGIGKRQIGLVAQDVEKVFPELIYEDMEGYKMVDYQKLTAVLVESAKEQQKQIDKLKAENDALKSENTNTKADIKVLKEEIQKLKISANGGK